MMSLSTWLKSRAATPRLSVNWLVRRGRRAPTIWTVPVTGELKFRTASVMGRGMVASGPVGDVIV
jgi:hypothetical protein